MSVTLTRESQLAERAAPRAPSWLREPLLHFLVLGALLFAIDHALVSRDDDPRVIVVGKAVDDEATQVFTAARGRAPDAAELAALRRTWLDNEILYREGLALQVDRGDIAIRERVIFKALSIVDANLPKPVFDEAAVRAWFEKNRAKYDEPARFDFQEAVLSGDSSESAARALEERLNGGAPGDIEAGLRVFKGRPRDNVVQSYGSELAAALESSPVGQWRALRTRDGWRVLKLESLTAARPADFSLIGTDVQQDWVDATASEKRTAAVRALAAKYTVRYETASR